MKAAAREIGYAILAWLIPFAVSVCLFPLRQSHQTLFESAMGFTLTASTTLLGSAYLRRVTDGALLQAARVGVTWVLANWVLDFLMFSSGPMKMSLHQYLTEIATAYFVIPVITIGLGWMKHEARMTKEAQMSE